TYRLGERGIALGDAQKPTQFVQFGVKGQERLGGSLRFEHGTRLGEKAVLRIQGAVAGFFEQLAAGNRAQEVQGERGRLFVSGHLRAWSPDPGAIQKMRALQHGLDYETRAPSERTLAAAQFGAEVEHLHIARHLLVTQRSTKRSQAEVAHERRSVRGLVHPLHDVVAGRYALG